MARLSRKKILKIFKTSSGSVGDYELIKYMFDNADDDEDCTLAIESLYRDYSSLKNVFLLKNSEIMAIDYLTEKQIDIVLVHKMLLKKLIFESERDSLLLHPEKILSVMLARYENKTSEQLEVYYIDESGEVAMIFTRSNNSAYRVKVLAFELINDIHEKKPKGIIIAHNHPNGRAHPSYADLQFTKYVQYCCELCGTKLLDHYICGGDGTLYSFKKSRRLKAFKIDEDFEKIFELKRSLSDDIL